MSKPVACEECRGSGFYAVRIHEQDVLYDCKRCGGRGWSNVDPYQPAVAPPGPTKLPWLIARASLEIPLWNEEDTALDTG